MCEFGCGWTQAGDVAGPRGGATLGQAPPIAAAVSSLSDFLHLVPYSWENKSPLIVCDCVNSPMFYFYGQLWSSSLFWHAFYFADVAIVMFEQISVNKASLE